MTDKTLGIRNLCIIASCFLVAATGSQDTDGIYTLIAFLMMVFTAWLSIRAIRNK